MFVADVADRMVVLTERAYDAVRERERREPDVVAPVIELLGDPDRDVAVTGDLVALAGQLVEQRHGDAVDALISHALTTTEVIARVRTWNDRRTVASARRRRQLLGVTVGGQTYHPDWQFSRTGLRAGVEDIVGPLLATASDDAILADHIMRHPRPELDGASLADLLAAGRTREIVEFLILSREGYSA